ncbi:MAG: 2-oxoacid:ferredoxin oxidoreductase subunit beta [Firmicutes bacterium]|nr:2-oxoacid:ferredoxin oxidoreductase subunit beta [Bacillota bacterium]
MGNLGNPTVQGKEYLRIKKLPHIWCPGCGNGIIISALVRALERLPFEHRDLVVVSGIGCSSRASGYLNFNTFHTTHGRALAYATGLKMARPELKIIVIMGDGDCAAIGGNHFIHAARRNIGLSAIVINNYIYGMTGGQHSPLTPRGKKASTAPEGTQERPFDLLALGRAAGATFGARGTAANPRQLERLIARQVKHKGFSVLEALSVCPTSMGRRNREGSAVDMLRRLKERSVTLRKRRDGKEPEILSAGFSGREDKIITGVLFAREEPEYSEEYYRRIKEENG